MAATFLILLGAYLSLGLLFAVVFVCFGAEQIDPHAKEGTWGFRLLIVPGAAALWPLLLSRWRRGIHEPPEQCDPHRRAALDGRRRREESLTEPQTPSQSLVTSAPTDSI